MPKFFQNRPENVQFYFNIQKGQKWPNVKTILFLANTSVKGQMATLQRSPRRNIPPLTPEIPVMLFGDTWGQFNIDRRNTLVKEIDYVIHIRQGFSNFFCWRPQKLFLKIWRPSKIFGDPLYQWFLTFFGPWTPKSQTKFPRTPKLSKCTIGGPLKTCKRGLKGYNTLLL